MFTISAQLSAPGVGVKCLDSLNLNDKGGAPCLNDKARGKSRSKTGTVIRKQLAKLAPEAFGLWVGGVRQREDQRSEEEGREGRRLRHPPPLPIRTGFLHSPSLGRKTEEEKSRPPVAVTRQVNKKTYSLPLKVSS